MSPTPDPRKGIYNWLAEKRNAQPAGIKLPVSKREKERLEELDSMHEKYSQLLAFKNVSAAIMRDQEQLFRQMQAKNSKIISKQHSLASLLAMPDDVVVTGDPNGRKHKIKIKRKGDEKMKITFDFKGNLMK